MRSDNESPSKAAIAGSMDRGPYLLHVKNENKISGVAKHSIVIDHIGPLMSRLIMRAFNRMSLNEKSTSKPTKNPNC